MSQSRHLESILRGVRGVGLLFLGGLIFLCGVWTVRQFFHSSTFGVGLINRSGYEVTNIVATYSNEDGSSSKSIYLGNLKRGQRLGTRLDGIEPNLKIDYVWQGQSKFATGGYVIPGVTTMFAIDPDGSAHQFLDE